MTEKENIIVPRWFLEVVENTLRIQNNINLEKGTGETCQDRNVKESLNGIRKLLKGEELTGMERLEKLQPSLPSNLDEAAKESAKKWRKNPDGTESRELFFAPYIRGFKVGAEWMAGQGETVEGYITDEIAYNGIAVILDNEGQLKPDDKVIVQIRKKEE